jgi:uncharacterized membrane protein
MVKGPWPGWRQGLDVAAIEEALRAAERRTSAEIRVSVARFGFWGDLHRAAERAFRRLGMSATRDRTGVLFFIVPSRRRFVVLGDAGIHQVVGPTFWNEVAAAMEEGMRRGGVTAGVLRGITAVGDALAAHFPFDPARDQNELPDQVTFHRR